MNNFVTNPVKVKCCNCGRQRATRLDSKCLWCVSGVKVTPEERQNINSLFTN